MGAVQELPVDKTANIWGKGRAYFTFGCNSRVRAKRARRARLDAAAHVGYGVDPERDAAVINGCIDHAITAKGLR